MKTEILNLTGTISAPAAEQAAASLKSIPGVQDVSVLDAPLRLYVRIGGDAPSRPQLVAALALAGVQVDEGHAAHRPGSCCGGCGS